MARSGALEPASESSARGDRDSDSGRGEPVSDVMRVHEVTQNVPVEDAALLEEVVNLGHYPRDLNAEQRVGASSCRSKEKRYIDGSKRVVHPWVLKRWPF